MGVQQVGFWYVLHEVFFDLHHVFARGNTGSVADPENMGVYSHCQLPESCIEHNVCRFTTYPGQCFKLFSGLWDLAAMALNL